MPAQLPAHNPATYLRPAFQALNWPGMEFKDSMFDPARFEIIEFIATHWPKRPMEHIVSISRVDWLATDAAQRHTTAQSANPYTEHSAAGGLFIKCFNAEKTRIAQAAQAQAAIENIAN